MSKNRKLPTRVIIISISMCLVAVLFVSIYLIYDYNLKKQQELKTGPRIWDDSITQEQHVQNLTERFSSGENNSCEVYPLWSFENKPEYYLVIRYSYGQKTASEVYIYYNGRYGLVYTAFLEVGSLWEKLDILDNPEYKLYFGSHYREYVSAFEYKGVMYGAKYVLESTTFESGLRVLNDDRYYYIEDKYYYPSYPYPSFKPKS